jgi:tRNA (Thr-GGU) A37 N-methylase
MFHSWRSILFLLCSPVPPPPITKQLIETEFIIKSIGIIHSPYLSKFNTPKQATVMTNGTLLTGTLQVFEQYKDCLSHLDGFDYCWVITYMNRNSGKYDS